MGLLGQLRSAGHLNLRSWLGHKAPVGPLDLLSGRPSGDKAIRAMRYRASCAPNRLRSSGMGAVRSSVLMETARRSSRPTLRRSLIFGVSAIGDEMWPCSTFSHRSQQLTERRKSILCASLDNTKCERNSPCESLQGCLQWPVPSWRSAVRARSTRRVPQLSERRRSLCESNCR